MPIDREVDSKEQTSLKRDSNYKFFIYNMYLKISSLLYQPFCLNSNMLYSKP